MLHSEEPTSKLALLKRSRVAFLKQFGRDEDGSIIILTILLLIVMLVMGGMAVDFMRFESRRALLQSVSDRAVLSAASLDQTLPGDEVIIDFFDKAGFDGTIVGTPTVKKEPGTGSSEVSVNSRIDVNTFYLRLIGIDELSAPASSSAVQGAGNIEISLVLDISGSMRHWVQVDEAVINETTGEPELNEAGDVITQLVWRRKIELLQSAASDFVDDLLIEDYRGQISINLIPYSQQVALSDDFYKALRTTPDSISEGGEVGSSFGALTDGYATLPEDPDAPIDISWANGEDVFVNPARCIDFEEADFDNVEFDVSKRYDQVEYFEHYSDSDEGIDFPVCPDKEFETILLASQDATELKRRINLFRPTTFTSIHLGVKWGISLLDPDLRPILAGIDSIDDAFQGSRPSNYSGDTLKYLVVMTDGQNQADRRVAPTAYNTYEWRKIWAEYPLEYWVDEISPAGDNEDQYTRSWGSNTQFNTWMETLCNAAKPKMSIYTIAMGAGDGAAQIAKCASQPSYAFATNFNSAAGEPGIDEIFDTIAQRIKALRLNL